MNVLYLLKKNGVYIFEIDYDKPHPTVEEIKAVSDFLTKHDIKFVVMPNGSSIKRYCELKDLLWLKYSWNKVIDEAICAAENEVYDEN